MKRKNIKQLAFLLSLIFVWGTVSLSASGKTDSKEVKEKAGELWEDVKTGTRQVLDVVGDAANKAADKLQNAPEAESPVTGNGVSESDSAKIGKAIIGNWKYSQGLESWTLQINEDRTIALIYGKGLFSKIYYTGSYIRAGKTLIATITQKTEKTAKEEITTKATLLWKINMAMPADLNNVKTLTLTCGSFPTAEDGTPSANNTVYKRQ